MYNACVMSNIVRTELRLPPDLHAVLVALAAQEERSLNQQIVYLLRKAIAAPASAPQEGG